MSSKKLPFTHAQIAHISQSHPTPFHIYDEQAMRLNAQRLRKAFSWNPGFKEFFAVKACPNPHIVKILHEEGFGVDCSSLAELQIAERMGIGGEEIFFSSNDTPAEEYVSARRQGAIINLDDISHIPFLKEHAGLPELISFRFNPGPERAGNAIIGNPVEAKYGLTRAQLVEAYREAAAQGVRRFGLHTMVISNELNPDSFVETAEMMFSLVAELSSQLGIRFEFVNLGGGIGIPYRPEQQPVDLEYVAQGIKSAYQRIIEAAHLPPLNIYTESGRMITGPYGYLVSSVRHIKKTYKDYAGLDACMADLMRPALYGAYHHISVLGKEHLPLSQTYDVTGSLCENNDKFAIDRPLPPLERGDMVVIHDSGAHGHAMGFNYNGKLRHAELLLRPDGSVVQIRRAETLQDYFATVDFSQKL